MNHNDWVKREHTLLEAFTAWWVEQNGLNPELFPLEMGDADWDEQFAMWCYRQESKAEMAAFDSAAD